MANKMASKNNSAKLNSVEELQAEIIRLYAERQQILDEIEALKPRKDEKGVFELLLDKNLEAKRLEESAVALTARCKAIKLLPAPEHLTEVEQANKFLEFCDGAIRYCSAFGWCFYQPTGKGGGSWVRDDATIFNYVANKYSQFRKIQDEALNEGKKENPNYQVYQDFFSIIDSNRKICSILEIVKRDVRCAIAVEEFDKGENLFNAQNGVVDLTTGNIRECTKKDLFLCISPFSYKKAFHDEVWEKELETLVTDSSKKTDKELISYLQLVAGCCCWGHNDHQKLIIAYGEGGCGKHTIFESIANALGCGFNGVGGYSVHNESTVLFSRDDTTEKRRVMAGFFGKRIAILGEPDGRTTLNSATLKALVSLSRQTAENKYEKPFEYVPEFTPIMITNDIPNMPRSVDHSITDRLVIIPFTVRIRNTANDVKNYIKNVLIKEHGDGILSWCIDGAIRAHELNFKFDKPNTVKAFESSIFDKYSTSDELKAECQAFVNDCCVVTKSENEMTDTNQLYSAYSLWCDEQGTEPKSRQAFFRGVETIDGVKPRVKVNKAHFFRNLLLRGN